jgi:hypothetical protein
MFGVVAHTELASKKPTTTIKEMCFIARSPGSEITSYGWPDNQHFWKDIIAYRGQSDDLTRVLFPRDPRLSGHTREILCFSG